MVPETALLITCEHAGNRIPSDWKHLFTGAEELLASHRGYDPGALELARRFSRELQVPLVHSTVSRLLIELNRSVGHAQLYSEFTRNLSPRERQILLACYYEPYRSQVQELIEQGLRACRRVVHLSVHSFTPVLDGVQRPIDVGLLYDPARPEETRLCRAWQRALLSIDPALRVRRNAPYRGVADGLVTALRRLHSPQQYVGIELEVNQVFPLSQEKLWPRLQRLLVETFLEALSG